MNDELRDVLKRVFGHDDLRPGQAEVIDLVLAGENTLAVLPTGGGKSLCYQLPAVVFGGLTLVISPLIALMRDQVEALKARGILAERWDSSCDDDFEPLRNALNEGRVRLLYLSPERMLSPELWDVLKSLSVDLISVDESHCVAEWGPSFRPAYLRLAKRVRQLKPRSILALTATASPSVAREIRKSFGILKRHHVQTSFFRPNLHYSVTPCADDEKNEVLLKLLADRCKLPAIVYATRRETVETLATLLRGHGFEARAFHAGMSTEARGDVQDGFVNGDVEVICATIAFGMGVDMAGVRSVVHYQPPKSPEGWIQESGRAGRDGKQSWCELILSGNDQERLESFVLAQKPTLQAIRNILESVFSQGMRAVVSRYDFCTLNDMPWALLDILLARLELAGWLVEEQGSWLWCHAVPLVPIDHVLQGFSPAQKKVLRPILESRQRVSLREISGGTASGQMKLMALLAELNASDDVRMKFSHSLSHFKIRKFPESLSELADEMYAVFEEHAEQEIKKIESVVAMATSKRCLAVALVGYFGEKLPKPCGVCSSCLGTNKRRNLPYTEVDEVSDGELETIFNLVKDRKPALATPERLARFLCGIYSPGMMRYRLYQRNEWGMLSRLPYGDVLAVATAVFGR